MRWWHGITTCGLFLIVLIGYGITFQPAYADRYVTLEKTIDVSKEKFCKVFTDLNNYKHVFPEYIKSVAISEETDKAKFTIEVEGTQYEADVKSSVQPDCKYNLDVVSGDLKGTNFVTTMSKTWGFDGTPDTGTIVKTELSLKTPWHIDVLFLFIGNNEIKSALETGIYKFAEYTKIHHPPAKASIQNVAFEQDSQMKYVIKPMGEETALVTKVAYPVKETSQSDKREESNFESETTNDLSETKSRADKTIATLESKVDELWIQHSRESDPQTKQKIIKLIKRLNIILDKLKN